MAKINLSKIEKLLKDGDFIPDEVKNGLLKSIDKFSELQIKQLIVVFEQKKKKEKQFDERIDLEKEKIIKKYLSKVSKIKDKGLPAFLKFYEQAKRNVEKGNADKLLNEL